MLDKIKKGLFPTIIALSALSVSASAAFYSVSGLSKLFAGASLQVMIMAGSLEVAKLVIATLLHRYWSVLSRLLKIYLTTATLVLVMITSMGIYGFLSAAYQETANIAGNIDAQISLVEVKRDNVREQLAIYSTEKESINSAISDLRSGLSNNKIQYRDKETGQIITTTSSSTRRSLEKQLDQAISRQTEINAKVDQLNEELFNYETEIVEIQTGSDLAGELGPLKYISGITGYPMDKIVNILLLVIIFVFDPLAISLVIAANFAFDQLKPKVKENIYGEKTPLEVMTENDQAMGLWDGDHELDEVLNDMVSDEDMEELNEDLFGEEDEEEPNEALKEAAQRYKSSQMEFDFNPQTEWEDKDVYPEDMETIELPVEKSIEEKRREILDSSISSYAKNKALKQLNLEKSSQEDNDLTITY